VGTWDGLDCYLYAGYYHDASGTSQPIMNSKDILLSGQAVGGVRCFASIQDKNAQWQPLSIFARMYDGDDPSVTYILTQSAPLMVPVNSNNTLKATVLE
jgi:Phage major capsid protein E